MSAGQASRESRKGLYPGERMLKRIKTEEPVEGKRTKFMAVGGNKEEVVAGPGK